MKKKWLAVVFGSALFLAACGGDDDNATPDDANDVEETATEDVATDDVATDEGATTDEDVTTEDATDEGVTDEGATDEEAADDAATEDGVDEATIAKGEELVQRSCTMCHGGNLEGAGSNPGLKGLTEEEIIAAIEEGPGAMPANLLKGEDAQAAAAYLATLE